MDKYGIDSHKLMYHPREVSKWIDGEDFYPIYIEISPSNGCNHRCRFCSFDFTGYQTELLDYKLFEKNVPLMAKGGVKAVMFAGEGEPLIHPRFAEIVQLFGINKIDTALTTNGSLMTKEMSAKTLPYFSWIKFSVDAATPETHAYLHGCNEDDFDKVMTNIKDAIDLRDSRHYKCTIGAQAVLFRENKDELVDLAIKLRQLGADYLVIKPFTDHQYRSKLDLHVDYDNFYIDFSKNIRRFSDDKFPVILRDKTFHDLTVDRCYRNCHALNFWSYIDSYGDVYACSNFLGNQDYVYGNLYKNTFDQIWEDRHKRKIKVDLRDCRQICRMDKINQYLDGFVKQQDGVNFI